MRKNDRKVIVKITLYFSPNFDAKSNKNKTIDTRSENPKRIQ